MRPRLLALVSAAVATAAVVPAAATGSAGSGSGPLAVARDAAPVVLTGAQIPAWAAPAAEGIAQPQPSGASSDNPLGDQLRSAHNGRLVVPPTPPGVTPVNPDEVAAYSWDGTSWKQIPVQIDQRFPYFLANGRSGFGFYSGTDEELTYAWAPDAHDVGEESWKKMFGDCTSRFGTPSEIQDAIAHHWLTPGAGETAADYLSSMQDPQPLFDTDDELTFMASDAGAQAPQGTPAPQLADGTHAANGQMVTVTDPLDPTDVRYVYLFTQPGGSSYDAVHSPYVRMTRDTDPVTGIPSDEWIDRYSFDDSDPAKIGTSNTGYGPNLPGTVCRTSPGNYDRFGLTADTAGAARPSTDRQPRDSFTVKTDDYIVRTTGRWLVQHLQVASPDGQGYSDNIVARWKGRAFQQSPDSSVSLVGFEDEQVNWELNSALLGWRQGPVRAIREVWGADSGTNVTKTETYYRDADAYAFHVRVHPIPPDGLYTDWSYRPGVATTYYNVLQQNGVPIDGQPDTSGNEIDQLPNGQAAYVNTCDPKFTVCSSIENPEEVAGPGFGLVYEFELTSPTGLAGNMAAVPYYRDDACFDDGTGDAPVQRPWPGEASTDPRVQNGYLSYWQNYWDTHPEVHGYPRPASYSDLKCQPALAVNGDPTANPTTPPWQIMPFSGAIGEHGIHFFVTQDSDNAFGPKNVDEIDGQQWRFEVPMAKPTNVLVPYGANVSAKLVAVATPYAG
ncbi:MAG TPA: hypothetical protein VFH66_11595 [Mycobacteriales bacterium]|nr:hypothetical protein [Mycobacteriales bacterium]